MRNLHMSIATQNNESNWAIFALTSNAVGLGKRVKLQFPNAELYTSAKWADEDCICFSPDFKTSVSQSFQEKTGLIFIMATGIVVRTIAPFIINKTSDPAVVVLDEKGEYVISLLSGHIGGANEMAKLIAEKIGAIPIITTSSDLNDVLAVDLFAMKNHLIIADMTQAKVVTALLVEKKMVALINQTRLTVEHDYAKDPESAEAFIVVSNRKVFDLEKEFVQLIPQNIVLGVGCRRGVAADLIIGFITRTLNDLAIDWRSIKCLATIDLKQDEIGIIEAAKHFNCPMQIIDRSAVLEVEHQFVPSGFVKSNVGVSSVCEPAAYLAGDQKGEFLLRKTAFQGITLAVFEQSKI